MGPGMPQCTASGDQRRRGLDRIGTAVCGRGAARAARGAGHRGDGDGTFGFHCAELDTAVRYGLPFLAVVGNDARWNAEYQIQLRDYGHERAIGCELLPSRYDKVCIGFGGHGEHVTSAAALLEAVERALSSGLPACVNVMIEIKRTLQGG